MHVKTNRLKFANLFRSTYISFFTKVKAFLCMTYIYIYNINKYTVYLCIYFFMYLFVFMR